VKTQTILMLSVSTGLAATARGVDRLVPDEYPTIQAAISAAVPGDTVLVADGLYTGDGNRDISFLGKAITVRSQNGPQLCIIDCQASPDTPHRSFAFNSGEGSDSVLQGFTLRNGATPQGAIADTFNGAGVLCTQESSPTLRDLVITGSWAGCWGGAICCSFNSHPLIDRCVIVDNYSDDDGGGIFAWAGSMPTIMNTVIAGNISRISGGGITTFSSGVTVLNSTIVGNGAIVGSGVWAASNTTFSNSIIWGNDGAADVAGSPAITWSLVEGGYPGEGNVDMAPNFHDAEAADYRLAAHSPLIDRGDPAYEPDEAETDADGNPRLVGARIDMGAYEFQGEPCFADFGGDGAVDFADLLSLLTAWGDCPDCPQDLDRNGEVGFADLIMILAQWGPCP
jgi:hypothetical protein